jgi:hypothetical protein
VRRGRWGAALAAAIGSVMTTARRDWRRLSDDNLEALAQIARS